MLRLVGALTIVVAVIAVLVLAWLWDRRDERQSPPTDREAQRAAQLMASCLDRALVEPMLRQSTEWEDEARRLVDDYYRREKS